MRKNNGLIILCILCIPLFSLSCVSNKGLQEYKGKIQGVVSYESGNQMPSLEKKSYSKRVERELFFFELLNSNDITMEGSLYDLKGVEPVLKIVTDESGEFKVSIKEGIYSLLTKEDKGFYASVLDKENNLNPVEVKRGQTTKVNFLINYNAYY